MCARVFSLFGANPAFIPLGGPSIYPAWRTQHLSRLAGPVFIPLGEEPSVYAAWREPSIYPAWRAQCLRRLADPVFIPLGGPSIFAAWRPQCLRRLAVSMKNPFPLPVKGLLFRQGVTAVAVSPRYPSPLRQVAVVAAAGRQGLLYSHCVHRMPPSPL